MRFGSKFVAWNILGILTLAACSAPPVAPQYTASKALDAAPDDPENPQDLPDDKLDDDKGSYSDDPVDDKKTDETKSEDTGGSKPGSMTPTPDTTPTPKPDPTPTPKPISSEGDGRFNLKKSGDRWPTAHAITENVREDVDFKSFVMNASESKIFPMGDPKKAPNLNQKRERRVYVMLPPNFDSKIEYPFMIGMDAEFGGWKESLFRSVKQAIKSNQIPAMVAIAIENGGGDSRGNQRGLEYDVVSNWNAKFIAEEVIPKVEQTFKVKLSKSGEGGGLYGGSSSGAAAFTAAWHMPERFQKVLGYSSTFTKQGAIDKDSAFGGLEINPFGAEIYYEKLIAESPVKPIRFALEVSSTDNKYFGDTTRGNILTYEALSKKGYHVKFIVAEGAGHVDGGVRDATFIENLIWLWRDYPR